MDSDCSNLLITIVGWDGLPTANFLSISLNKRIFKFHVEINFESSNFKYVNNIS
jgi:hypothetical protein